MKTLFGERKYIMKIRNIEVGNAAGWVEGSNLNPLHIPVCLQASRNICTHYITGGALSETCLNLD